MKVLYDLWYRLKSENEILQGCFCRILPELLTLQAPIQQNGQVHELFEYV